MSDSMYNKPDHISDKDYQRLYNKAFYDMKKKIKDLDKYKGDAERTSRLDLGFWNPENQAARFDVLLEHCLTPNNTIKLLDFGCGYGHLWDHATQQGYLLEYTGIDIEPDFIEGAQAHKREGTHFICGDALELNTQFDWVYSSGAFSSGFTHEMIETYVNHFLSITSMGVCFNFLSKSTKSPTDKITFYFDAEELCNLFKNKGISSEVIDGYDPVGQDTTIILRHI